MALTMKTAEPFYFPGGPTGCLLVHGFTGTPKEMRWLGEYLAKRGHTVAGVRLAGHATSIEDMMRTRWCDWLACVEDGWNMLSYSTERRFVIGLSLGGMLALAFAARFPVAGVVAIAAPHHLPSDWRLKFVKLLSAFKPQFEKGPPDWFDQLALAQHVSYIQDPTKGYAELLTGVAELHASLPLIHAPALLIYSRSDKTVRAADRHADLILSELGSQDKRLVWVENSGHVIPEDAERLKVFQEIQTFIEHVAPGG